MVYFLLKKLDIIFFFFTPATGGMRAGMTSSRYGLYKLGYMFATMRISIPSPRGLDGSVPLSTDRFLQFETREGG